MISSRPIQEGDNELLSKSLQRDSYHKTMKPEFFNQPNAVCNVYEDDKGPVLFLRGTAAMRLDIQFVDNRDFERNREVMVTGFPLLVEQVKANGFTEIIFNSNSPYLVKFCVDTLGFVQSEGELRYFI